MTHAGDDGRALTKDLLFRLLAEEACKDGRLDERERALLERTARFLRLDGGAARDILHHAHRKWQAGKLGTERPLDRAVLYRKALMLAAADGRAERLETMLLQGLRRLLQIDDTEHRAALDELRRAMTERRKPPAPLPRVVLSPWGFLRDRMARPALWCADNAAWAARLGTVEPTVRRACMTVVAAALGGEPGSDADIVEATTVLSAAGGVACLALSPLVRWLDGRPTACDAVVAALRSGLTVARDDDGALGSALVHLSLDLAHAARTGDVRARSRREGVLQDVAADDLPPRLRDALNDLRSAVALDDMQRSAERAGTFDAPAAQPGGRLVEPADDGPEAGLVRRLNAETMRVATDMAVRAVLGSELAARGTAPFAPCVVARPARHPRPFVVVDGSACGDWIDVTAHGQALAAALDDSDGHYDVVALDGEGRPARCWFQCGDLGDDARWASRSLVARGHALVDEGQLTAAHDVLMQAMLRQPLDPAVAGALARLAEAAGRPTEALEYAEQQAARLPATSMAVEAVRRLAESTGDPRAVYWRARRPSAEAPSHWVVDPDAFG